MQRPAASRREGRAATSSASSVGSHGSVLRDRPVSPERYSPSILTPQLGAVYVRRTPDRLQGPRSDWPCAGLVSPVSLLDGGSSWQGGSHPQPWAVKTQTAPWLEARWERRDPRGRGSPRQTHPPHAAEHALRPLRRAAPCRPSGVAGTHGSCRCARRGRTDQQSATSLLQQPLHSHVHSPDAVSFVPVEFRPNHASVRKLDQRSTLKLAPSARSVQPSKQPQKPNPPADRDDLDVRNRAAEPEAGHATTLPSGYAVWCPSNAGSAARAAPPALPRNLAGCIHCHAGSSRCGELPRGLVRSLHFEDRSAPCTAICAATRAASPAGLHPSCTHSVTVTLQSQAGYSSEVSPSMTPVRTSQSSGGWASGGTSLGHWCSRRTDNEKAGRHTTRTRALRC